MTGPLNLLPFAALAMYDESQAETVMRELETRINRETSDVEAKQIWGLIRILLGLRFSEERIDQMIIPLEQLEDSVTAQ